MKRMFKGCWLLSDLDGTLIPTPHKAQGQYVPLQMSVCYEPIKRWLSNGGNLCVVTTADRRVFDQVYFSLRPLLNSVSSPPSESGELLLSLYTGASLYRCGREGIEYVPDYYDPTLPAGTDTCMDLATCSELREVVIDVFLNLASDVIHQRPPVAPGWEKQLSNRYQVMWRSFLRYLNKRYDERKAYIEDPSRPRKVEYDAKWGHLDALIRNGQRQDWMEEFLRTKRQLLVKVGIVRQEALRTSEELKEFVWLKTGGLQEDEGASQTRPAFSDPLASQPEIQPTVEEGLFGDATQAKSARFAQLIVVGVPLKLYTHYFSQMSDTFAQLGVHPIAQPNSVVFSKLRIGKGTTVNYLDSKLKLHGEEYHNCFRGRVNLETSVALGDNPNSADRELALIPRLSFVSLERSKQRNARHAFIDSDPNIVVATADEDRVSTDPTGVAPLHPVDDRRLPNIHFTGHEEDGCARFLTDLMDRLEEEHKHSGGAGKVCSLPQVFKPTVAAAAEAVRIAQEKEEAMSKTSKL